jgi:hypothetical protein
MTPKEEDGTFMFGEYFARWELDLSFWVVRMGSSKKISQLYEVLPRDLYEPNPIFVSLKIVPWTTILPHYLADAAEIR